MVSELSQREDELGGQTLLIVGLGRIGSRLASWRAPSGCERSPPSAMRRPARLRRCGVPARPPARAVAAGRRRGADLPAHAGDRAADRRAGAGGDETVGDPGQRRARAGGRRAGAGRGAPAKRIAAAGIDCTVDEPLAAASPLWALDNALITPHTAGETRRYEDNVIDLLVENLQRIWRGETQLRNHVV